MTTTMPGPGDFDDFDIREMIAYHEAGHAVVARKLGIEVAHVEIGKEGSQDARRNQDD